MDVIDLFLLFLSGCAGGFLAGLLGIGGGIIYVVIFSFYLEKAGVPSGLIVPAIVANSMMAILFSSISGTLKHIRNGNFHPTEIISMGIPAALFSIAGTRLIAEGNWYTKERFTLLFVILLAYTAVRLFRERDVTVLLKPEKKVLALNFLIGIAGGVLAALSGLGGGIVMIPLMTNLLHFNIKKATTVSLGVIVIITLAHSVYSMLTETGQGLPVPHSVGLICLSVVLPVTAGSIAFSPVGVTAAGRSSSKALRIYFCILILCVITQMLYTFI